MLLIYLFGLKFVILIFNNLRAVGGLVWGITQAKLRMDYSSGCVTVGSMWEREEKTVGWGTVFDGGRRVFGGIDTSAIHTCFCAANGFQRKQLSLSVTLWRGSFGSTLEKYADN